MYEVGNLIGSFIFGDLADKLLNFITKYILNKLTGVLKSNFYSIAFNQKAIEVFIQKILLKKLLVF